MTTKQSNNINYGGLVKQAVDRVKPHLSSFMTDGLRMLHTHGPHFMRGLTISVTGMMGILSPSATVNKKYWPFFKDAYLPVLGAMYGAFAVFAFFFFPITVGILIFAPALLWQILTTISVYSLHIATKRHPVEHGYLFIEGIREVDPKLAQDFERRMNTGGNLRPRDWIQAIQESFDDKIYFWTYSFIFLLFSILPIIGTIITAAAHTYLVSEKLAWRILDTYMTKIEKMSHADQTRFINKYWSLLFGYCFPYVVLSSIPIVGPFMLLYAEVFVAKLFYSDIYMKEGKFEKTETSNIPTSIE